MDTRQGYWFSIDRGRAVLAEQVARRLSPKVPRWRPRSCSLRRLRGQGGVILDAFPVDHGRAREVKWTEFSDSPRRTAPVTRSAFLASDDHFGYLVRNCTLHVPTGYAFLNETVIEESKSRPGAVSDGVALEGASARLAGVQRNHSIGNVLESDVPKIYLRDGQKNFYHFLLEELPKLLKALLIFGELFVILPNDLPDWAQVEVDRFVSKNHQLRLPRAVISVNNLVIIEGNPWRPPGTSLLSILRNAYLGDGDLRPSGTTSTKSLYISRRFSTRSLQDEKEVEKSLAPCGFGTMFPSDFGDLTSAAHRFSIAQQVVGPYGAGLAALAFCSPGTSVIEIAVDDYHGSEYVELSSTLGLVHRVLNVSSAKVNRVPKILQDILDFPTLSDSIHVP